MNLDITAYDVTTAEGRRLIFNATVRKLNEQEGQCLRSNNSIFCAYASGARRCAVGWWLPDDDNEASEHPGAVGSLFQRFPRIADLLTRGNPLVEFWRLMQGLHDNANHWVAGRISPDAVRRRYETMIAEGYLEPGSSPDPDLLR